MQRKMSLAIVLSLMTLVTPPGASATPIPALDLPALINGADVILAGQVVALRDERETTIQPPQGRPITAREIVATLRAQRVLKGQVFEENIDVSFLVPKLPLGYAGLTLSQFGLFFLRRGSTQRYAFVSPYYPSIVAAADAPPAEGNAFNRVLAELTHVLTSAKATSDMQKQAIGILDGVGTPAALEVLRRGAPHLGAPLRLKAAGALLRRNDISALASVEEALLSPPPGVEPGELKSLAHAIRDGVTDARGIPSLARLLKARDVTIRRSAAAALRHTENDAAVDPLLAALQDSDREVRYQAVLGLATITGKNEWGPSIDLFEREEQRFLTYWHEWAKAR